METSRLILLHAILDNKMDEELLPLMYNAINEILIYDDDMKNDLISQKDSDHYKEVKSNDILNYGFMLLNLISKIDDSNETYILTFKIRILNKPFIEVIDNQDSSLLVNKYKLMYFNIQDDFSVFREYFEKKN